MKDKLRVALIRKGLRPLKDHHLERIIKYKKKLLLAGGIAADGYVWPQAVGLGLGPKDFVHDSKSDVDILVTAAKKQGCKGFSPDADPSLDSGNVCYSEALPESSAREVKNICRTLLAERQQHRKPTKAKKTTRKASGSLKAATKKKKRA